MQTQFSGLLQRVAGITSVDAAVLAFVHGFAGLLEAAEQKADGAVAELRAELIRHAPKFAAAVANNTPNAPHPEPPPGHQPAGAYHRGDRGPIDSSGDQFPSAHPEPAATEPPAPGLATDP